MKLFKHQFLRVGAICYNQNTWNAHVWPSNSGWNFSLVNSGPRCTCQVFLCCLRLSSQTMAFIESFRHPLIHPNQMFLLQCMSINWAEIRQDLNVNTRWRMGSTIYLANSILPIVQSKRWTICDFDVYKAIHVVWTSKFRIIYLFIQSLLKDHMYYYLLIAFESMLGLDFVHMLFFFIVFDFDDFSHVLLLAWYKWNRAALDQSIASDFLLFWNFF